MILRIFSAVLLSYTLAAAATLPAAYEKLKSEAEQHYAKGSFALAYETYHQVAVSELPPEEKRWVEFRLADTQWRSQAASQQTDTTKLEQARQQLEVLVRDVTRVEQQDRVWVEVQESLADFHWTRRNNNNWGAAWPIYQQVLDWWAGARDLEAARARYLTVIWRMAQPPQVEPYYYYGYWGNFVPLEILENALQIAQTDDDKAHAHYLIAMTLRNQGDWPQRARVPEEFEAALKTGKKTDWYDDALYNYAEWMTGNGRIIAAADGNWRSEPDYVKALELFRRVVNEFAKGESRFWEQAQQQIKNITDAQVGVSVPSVFLPDSEIQYVLSWRNVKQLELTLYPLALNRDVDLGRDGNWLQSIDTSQLEKMKSWSRDTRDSGDHKPGNVNARFEDKLKPGAYLLEAKGGGKSGRDLILVSDAALVLKSSGKQALLFFCNALNSEPLGGARFTLWERWHDGQRWQTRKAEKTADADGLAVFELSRPANQNLELFAGAILKDRQAFSTGQSYWQGRQDEPWRIYAFTDRPAYRPKETVQWKFLARRYDGSVYSTPSEQTIEFRIDDPRGAKVNEEKVKLNAFGSAWGSLELTEAMPLGEYRITFWDEGRQHVIGNATLFRLEEYKLPEFKVTVQSPEQNGRKKAFRLGEKVEVNIQSDYYFGGPVVNASVEVVVYQNPFYHSWRPPHDFPWFYDDSNQSRRGYGGAGQIIKRETLKTDAAGKASLSFETPRDTGQDFEYRIEARVTDASRREITGSGNVRVTRQRYYVYPQPDHNLYRPQDRVRVEFRALDANEQPVQTDAVAKVTRDYWFEIWLNPEGKEVKGEELQRLRSTLSVFPPPAPADRPGWRLKFRGYEHDEVLTKPLKTDTNGVAELVFTPEREGYYKIAWTSEDASSASNRLAAPPVPVRAETTVWVATGATTELGYRHSGLEIIVDKDTFRVGQKAPVMLVVPTNDRHVLFSVEGEDLYSYQVVHLDGTVKLIELSIEEKHVPNIFLSAALVHDRQIFTDTKQLIVPPTKNFLTVDVKADRPQYQPREEGGFSITTRDENGKGVPAEVALSLVDESVFHIQQDYAGDPRPFYFGTKRQPSIQTQSTMNHKRYARLVAGEKEELIDDRELERRRSASARNLGDYYAENEKRFDLDDAAGNRPDTSDARRERGFAGGRAGVAQESLGLAVASPAAASAALFSKSESKDKLAAFRNEMPAPEEQSPVQVRSDFRSTILWRPDLVTDENGFASIKITYPDSLTGWKATARVATKGNQFGIGDAATRTKMPLMVRLQAPRFFVVGDSTTLSAVINNNTDEPMEVKLMMDIAGGLKLARAASGSVKVPANGESRFDWTTDVIKPGDVKVKVTGRAAKYADAMEKSYLAYEHGIEKFLAKSGKATGDEVVIKLDLPKQRKSDSTTVTVQVTPSMAVTMLDALPYLVHYPYGCTEQTMSRFLPAAITAKTLKDLGLQPEDVMSRWFGGVEPAHAATTHPKGTNDLAQLDKIVQASLERLYDFQHADGGWGWWKDGDSDHWMTAYVVWGLTLARDAGVTVKASALERGVGNLDKTLVEQEQQVDMQAWMLHALAVYNGSKKTASPFQEKAFENLWTNREKLNAYTRALLALAAHHFGKTTQAKTLVENLANGVKRDERPDTSVLISPTGPGTATMASAHWGEDGIYWRWSEGGVEATAFALRALLAIDPQNKLIEPVTNWLIKNRRGAQWSSTRDTAIVVLAMNDYLRTSGELKTELEYEVVVNGTSVARKKISGADVFAAPSRFPIEASLIHDANEIRIKRRTGTGPLYFAAEAKFFSLEEPIVPAGNEIFVKRQYHKLVGRPTLLKGFVYDKQPLKDGEKVKSGERVEVLITIEAKNHYEYLIFEDLKPAGLEAVEIRSGESLYARELKSGAVDRRYAAGQSNPNQAQVTGSAEKISAGRRAKVRPVSNPAPAPEESEFTGRTRWVYQELRDRKVALFLDKLPEGVWEIRYDFRAEVPGQFHALPVTGYAMYVPEIRANGAELRIQVEEAAP